MKENSLYCVVCVLCMLHLFLYRHMYSLETSEESRAEPPGVKLYKHKESCRTLKFSPKGNGEIHMLTSFKIPGLDVI